MSPETVFILCRWAFFGAAIYLWGANAYLAACVRGPLLPVLELPLRRGNRIALVTVFTATVLLLPVRTALIADGWTDAVSPTVIKDVLFSTSIGQAWLAQSACLIALCLASRARRHALPLIVMASGALLATSSMTGHATMNDGWRDVVHRINDCLHILSGGAWAGALVPVLLTLSHASHADSIPEREKALIRFSRYGHVTVLLVLLTGVINSSLILQGTSLDPNSEYLRLLAIKILIVSIMVLVAVFNRYVVVPRIGLSRERAYAHLRMMTLVECILASLVLGLVAWFGTLDPS
ncbi:copper homeostasis membrane protein CopD [Rhizobium oryzicola]|uniref:Copper homeostasis membrane protein CopD n=1 Tax=Rhizobium oryzicola TaxID=1232668 RepID=A0ABT8SW55_9HYPH|nr:copper homeostasis membrane protein CopD [Rhizobium oryzicola]MDO1582571.1 copper homeostasis membrane protein CopD [Rhizobium oryzicola]